MAVYQSPIGQILVICSSSGISKLVFSDMVEMESQENGMESLFIGQLEEYFNHKRKSFDLPLDLQGTEFQKRVWNELLKIPFGKTITYKDLALKLGDVKAIRAVGAANGANPVSIIVPCHRVIGSDGSLTGYAGGLWRKKWLLEFESYNPILFRSSTLSTLPTG
jgi:methylated-DNA-[protein]-cysteine S-methyltransferase